VIQKIVWLTLVFNFKKYSLLLNVMEYFFEILFIIKYVFFNILNYYTKAGVAYGLIEHSFSNKLIIIIIYVNF